MSGNGEARQPDDVVQVAGIPADERMSALVPKRDPRPRSMALVASLAVATIDVSTYAVMLSVWVTILMQ
jgi:hypothetical protein